MTENCAVNDCQKRELTYEIERLRRALQQIVDSDGRFDTMYDIAKAALAIR